MAVIIMDIIINKCSESFVLIVKLFCLLEVAQVQETRDLARMRKHVIARMMNLQARDTHEIT